MYNSISTLTTRAPGLARAGLAAAEAGARVSEEKNASADHATAFCSAARLQQLRNAMLWAKANRQVARCAERLPLRHETVYRLEGTYAVRNLGHA